MKGKPVKQKIIIISDRNPHIRNLLKRELEACGYTVWVGEKTVNAIELCFHPSSPDLLIVDDSLLNFDRSMVMEKTGNRIPPIPVIISTFDQDQVGILSSEKHIHTILKQGGYDRPSTKSTAPREM